MGRANRGRRTDYEWSGGNFSAAEASGGSSVGTLVTINVPGTLMRIRGNVLVSIDGPTDGDKVIAAMGIILVTEEALAAGASAIANPGDINDLDAPWIWHQFLPLQSQAIVSTSAGQQFMRVEMDSKAMRKVKPTQSLVFRTANVALSGTPAVDYTAAARILFGS